MAIKTKYYVVASVLLFVKMSKAGNESNIQRLSKPRKESTKVIVPNFSPNGSSAERNDTKDSRLPLIEFSQNNPELDWKNYLKLATVEEEKQPRDLDVDFMNEKLEPSGNSVKWLADLYDPLKWLKAPGKLVGDCRKDMDWFLGSLKDGELWSAKMSDASGRYSSQFYFGNDFWLGSSTLCKELNGTNSDENFVTPENVPPYRVRFHVARMYLTLPRDVAPSMRQIFLGLCLPATCGRDDLMSMLRASADRVEKVGNTTHRGSGPKIHIASIKSVPANDYTPWTDPKVCILSHIRIPWDLTKTALRSWTFVLLMKNLPVKSEAHWSTATGELLPYIIGCAVGAAVLLLMIGATLYEHYRNDSEDPDLETSNPSNNNERISTYPDRNCSEERRISIVQDNGKELIEKINKTALTEREAKKREKGFWIRCLLAFSPTINGGKIISTDPAARDSLTCLHGLRVFSLGWVVMVHTYLQVFSIAENKTLRTVTERNFMFQTISNATFSVDTFFFISGLLVTILYYRSLGGLKTDKKNFLRTSAKKFFIMILYRFVRLTPAYLYVLGMNEVAMRQAQAKTVFSPAIMDHLTCEKFWWRNALYLNSLYPRTEMCMLWSWYMANDTQFYVLGIFLLLLSVKYLKLVVTTVALIIISSWFTTFTVAYSNDYMARIQEPFALFDELYDKPWLRAGPYFIGAITGYLLFKSNCKLETPLYVKIFGWLSSATVMFSVVYGLYPGNINVVVSSIYASLGHTAWSLAVAFIVIQCCTGSASLIDRFLSLRLMYPLSRLTYCAYLVHPVIMLITSTQMDGPLHLHNGLVLIVYFGNLVASYILSFCISIALEAPVVNLLKIAFISKKRSR